MGFKCALVTHFLRGTFAPKPETLQLLVADLRRFSLTKFATLQVTLRVCNFLNGPSETRNAAKSRRTLKPMDLAVKSREIVTHLATRKTACECRALCAWNIAGRRGTVARIVHQSVIARRLLALRDELPQIATLEHVHQFIRPPIT
jgi:hypothetical protein